MTKMFKRYGRPLVWVADVFLVFCAYLLAFQLRFEFALPEEQIVNFRQTVLIVLVCKMIAFYYFDLYRGFWRYASLTDLTSIFKAIVSSQVVIAAFVLFIRHGGFPRSVLIISPVLSLVLVGGVRFFIRFLREIRSEKDDGGTMKTVIYGAGDLGESISREIMRGNFRRRKILCFLDDDRKKWGRKIHGIQIMGGRGKLVEIVRKHFVGEVVVAVNHSRGKLISELVTICKDAELLNKVQIKTVPTLSEMLAHNPSSKTIGGMRNIELGDLLNRKSVQTDMRAVSGLVEGKVVLVTGAGGTIGAELSRQILNYKPKTLLLLENHNTALFYIDKELAARSSETAVVPIAGDVKDSVMLENIFVSYKPALVFHAAAHKHVPLMETNPQEAVKNNALATHLLATAASKHGVERFLYISTDKAVRPANVMGAAKRLGEMVITAMTGVSTTKFMAVRFGNVLGSSGSAVNIFKEQIAAGGPVTVTHPEITRYFMTTQEAIQLILHACSMGGGGEIFVLNMGEPVKVIDLVRNLILLSGIDHGKEIPIHFTGLRPGEKMYEELFRADDIRKDTGHPDIFMAVPEVKNGKLSDEQIAELGRLCNDPSPEPILRKIKELIPSYKITEQC